MSLSLIYREEKGSKNHRYAKSNTAAIEGGGEGCQSQSKGPEEYVKCLQTSEEVKGSSQRWMFLAAILDQKQLPTQTLLW